MSIITHLIVEETGAYIGKYQGRLQVRKGKEVIQQAPLLHLEQVVVSGRGVGLSAEAVAACVEQGVPIYFISFEGTPFASLYAAGLTGTVQTRRAQLLAYTDQRGVAIALAIATAKLKNQAALLTYLAKYRKEKEPALYQELRLLALEIEDHLLELDRLAENKTLATPEPTLNPHNPKSKIQNPKSLDNPKSKIQNPKSVDDLRAELMGLEGRAAQKYWQGVKQVVQVGPDWPGRKGRGAKDPVNSALNYGYGILYGQIEWAIVLAGLDPYAGFIHADRPGKPSLVLDLIEEFRQPVVDRAVFALLNKGTAIKLDEKGRLTEESRQVLIGKVFEKLETPEKYGPKKVPLRIIIQNQARHLATFMRGDRARYQGFEVKW